MDGVWVGFGEMGEFYGVGCGEGDDFVGNLGWGSVVLWGSGICMMERNGFVVGFWGDVAIGKYSGLVSRCTKSFRENKPPILIGFLR